MEEYTMDIKPSTSWINSTRDKPRKSRAIGFLTTKILESLPYSPKQYETWDFTVSTIEERFGGTTGSVYEILHTFEALLLVSRVRTFLNKFFPLTLLIIYKFKLCS